MDSFFDPQNSDCRRCEWMERTSFFLGMIAISGICLIYPSLMGGSFAIVFALLSRGGRMTLSPRAKIGLTLGIISICAAVFSLILMLIVQYFYAGDMTEFPAAYESLLKNYMSNP